MSAPTQSWSSIARDKTYAGGSRTFATEPSQAKPEPNANPNTNKAPANNTNPRQKRTTSPSHIPKTAQSQGQEQVYVLTLLTDTAHHKRMTALRNQYFPPKINKLDAHLTLFHALPQSKLEETIIPTIRKVVAETQPFEIHAAKPFRMKKGIAIGVPKNQGGEKAQGVHKALLGAWEREGWLSEQDAGGMRVHYTIMNKVDEEEEVARAMEEVNKSWKGDRGTAVGVGLWRYERGYWKWERAFRFGEGKDETK